jgi:hypothetical protein
MEDARDDAESEPGYVTEDDLEDDEDDEDEDEDSDTEPLSAKEKARLLEQQERRITRG